MNSYQTLAHMAAGLSNRGAAPAIMALRDHDLETWTYADLARHIAMLAGGLVELGVRPGEPVLLCAPNSPAWIVAYFAIVRSGALAVPLDDLSNDRDLARVIADSGAQRAFTSESHMSSLRALDGLANVDVVLLDGSNGGANVKSWLNLLTEAPISLPEISPDAFASLLYTSGTTGTPKAVPLTHRNILTNVDALMAGKLAGPEDRSLLPLPLHHAYPFTIGLLGTFASGGVLVLPAGISGPQITEALRVSRATILIGVPRLYTALLSAIEGKAERLNSVARSAFRILLKTSMLIRKRIGVRVGRVLFRRLHRELGPDLRILGCGGARLDPEVASKLEALGWEVLTGYGLTETAPIVTFNPRGRARIDSAGLPLPGVELRIDAKAGQPSGDILVRGPNVFAGYRNNPEATKLAFTPDGWFRTGDLGFLDQDGYLHIIGRVKEVIVLPDGKNVIPEDVEDLYGSSPLIREVAILEHHGTLAGLIVPDDEAIRVRGAARAQGLLREEVEDISLRSPPYQRLSRYKLTRETLPRTHLGKLRRHLLPDIYDRAERAAAAPVAPQLSDEDRHLLASEPAKEIWAWLVQRFPEVALTPDTSPQLDLQMDSLEWVTLSLEIQEHFGIGLTGDAIARIVTIRDLLLEATTTAGEKRDRQFVTEAQTVTPEELRWLQPRGPLLAVFGMLVLALNRLAMRGFFRLRVDGAEKLPRDGPFILTPNHTSFLDPSAIAAALPRRYLRNTYWAGWTGKMFAGPSSRLLSRIAGVFPVDQDRGPAGSLALGKAILERKQILVWFPEGRRSPTGEIRPFLPGIGILMQQTKVYAIPTLIQGAYDAMPRGRWLPRLRRIVVRFGEPMDLDQLDAMGEGEDKADRIANGLQQAVAALRRDTHRRFG